MSTHLAKVNSTQRQAKRYPLHYRDLHIMCEGYSEEIAIRPPDLSTQGMFIQTPRNFPEGAVLKVRFRLARSLYQVTARGEVRYCLPGVGVGLEFIDISSEARHAIQDELQPATSSVSRRS